MNNIYNIIVHVLKNSAEKPVAQKRKETHHQFLWNVDLNNAKTESLKCFQEWKKAGKPTAGPFLKVSVSLIKNIKNL